MAQTDFPRVAGDAFNRLCDAMRDLKNPDWPAGLGDMSVEANEDGSPVFRFHAPGLTYVFDGPLIAETRNFPPRARVIDPVKRTVKEVPMIAPDLN